MDNKNTLLPAHGNNSLSLPEMPGRRRFLSYLGLAATSATVIAACRKDKDDKNTVPPGSIDLGAGDMGILNYAYALEQLEAAFYTQVISSPFSGMTANEQLLLTDIRDHEIAHREFFKAALGTMAIKSLEVNFSSVNFGSRDSVLATAKAFEDLGVSAYNGAGQLIKNSSYLLLAGKIVSVEARHAALIRDLISNGSFADNTVVNLNGLDLSSKPTDVLATASVFLKSKLYAGNLPTS
ncbi:ferritin-like domain-containing protein [Chitinophaga polysaccharea]|uniref:ferritin-like domain-containing protein n=1 Tax=Chitinophaga polysaccharea TaxID=1293035 RepID=UPI001455C74C|nr:ferritin-like domain-containing protein [Chitinophaga polysaccharea]NLR60398.1 ferritin-like domain-containing protein [Chitinophaga polysaccharea]